MTAPIESDVTRLLDAAGSGDGDAFREVFDLVYEELHRLAHHVRKGRASETMNTTALLHEAYIHLLPSQALDWQGRKHFMAVAARAMRQVLVRAAEKRTARKRGGGQAATSLDEGVHSEGALASGGVPGGTGVPGFTPERVVALDEALQRLETFAPRQARVVECRYFAGLDVDETADALDISRATVKRDWKTARAWLAKELSPA